jgi:1-phosphofructokinase
LPSACVFAPTPVLTVTIEAGERDAELHIHPGGQGFWVARLMAELGVHVRLCASLGGETGEVLRGLLTGEDLELRMVRVGGANGAYVHDRRSGSREDVATMEASALSRHELDELYGAALTASLDADVCVLGGPGPLGAVPSDIYRRLAVDIAGNGGTVVADLSGEALDAAVAGRVAVLKTSHEELLRDERVGSDDPDALLDVIGEIASKSGGAVVCSRAEQPALAVRGNEAMTVTSPPLEPVESRGAGDSFAAGLAAGLARRASLEDALRLAGAAGGMNVTRHGLGSGRRDQIEALAEHVAVELLERR